MSATLNDRFFPFPNDLYFPAFAQQQNTVVPPSNPLLNVLNFPFEDFLFPFQDYQSAFPSDLHIHQHNFPSSPISSDSDSNFGSVVHSPSSSPIQYFEGINERTEYRNIVPATQCGNKRDLSEFSQEESCQKKKKCRKSGDSSDSTMPKVVRPKVKEGKGSQQCVGTNRKKGTQCRNAALMEYIGPRPAYCAEHIELDPSSLYEKCKSDYQKDPGDNKGCKEIVLKEFGVCYKHFHDVANDMIRRRDYAAANHFNDRISELHAELIKEAASAKKKDADLFQRKNKLLPKFQEMKRMASKTVETLNYIQSHDESVREVIGSPSHY